MAGIEMRITARGLDGFRRAAGSALVAASGERLRQRLAEVTLALASVNIPVDEGGLLGSGEAVGGVVRYTAPNALFVHGFWSDFRARSTPHFPPIAAVEPWASRHGLPAFLVARAISIKGTALTPFLRNAAIARAGWDEEERTELRTLGAAVVGKA